MRWTKELYTQLRLFAYFVDQWSRNYSHFWKSMVEWFPMSCRGSGQTFYSITCS
jgi:hypothetical protein